MTSRAARWAAEALVLVAAVVFAAILLICLVIRAAGSWLMEKHDE